MDRVSCKQTQQISDNDWLIHEHYIQACLSDAGAAQLGQISMPDMLVIKVGLWGSVLFKQLWLGQQSTYTEKPNSGLDYGLNFVQFCPLCTPLIHLY